MFLELLKTFGGSRGLVDQKTIFSAFDFSEMGFRGF